MITLLGGSVTGQLVALLSAFVLTRMYGPKAFAHLEMFALVTGIGAVLGTGKFEQALMLPKDEKTAMALFGAGQRAVGITIMVVYAVALPTAHLIAKGYGLDGWVWLAYVLPLFTGIAAHTRLLEYWHHRQNQAATVAAANALGPVGAEGAKLGVSGAFSTTGLVWGSGVGLVIRWFVMRGGRTKLIKETWSWTSGRDADLIVNFKDYPTWVLAGSAMNRIAQWLHVLLLGVAIGPVLLGIVGFSRRMVMQPLSMLAAAAAPVLFKSATELTDGAPLRRLFWQAFGVFSAIAFGVWLTVQLLPDNTTAILFGEEWFRAMEVLRILVPWFALNFIASGLGAMFHRLKRPRWITALDALHLLMVALGWWIGTQNATWIDGDEWGALVGIVQAKCLYYFVNLAVLIFAVITHNHADS